jgi:hypothetical protein
VIVVYSLKKYFFVKNFMRSPVDYFTELTDPHVDRAKDHLMEDIICITIAAVICGAVTWNDIEQYGKSRLKD